MNNFMTYIINFGSIILMLTLLYIAFIYLKTTVLKDKALTQEQLSFLENTTRYAVNYAEQMYKTDDLVDRYKLALDFVYDVVNKAGYDYTGLIKIIKGLIESHVLQLPMTHKTE